jgi:predicted Zn-dependent peptidase
MLQRGTKTQTKQDIRKTISLLGDSYDFFIGTEYWGVNATVPSGDLSSLLTLTEDLLFNPQFDENELNKAKNIAIQSINTLEDSPFNSMVDFYQSVFYPDLHATSKMRIENIIDVELQTLTHIYQHFFTPDNMVIVLTGNFNSEYAFGLLADTFGLRSTRDKPIPEKPPGQERGSLPRHREKVGGLTQAGIFIGTRLTGFDRKDETVLKVLNAVLVNSVGGRLFKAVREEKGLVYDIRPHYSLRVEPYAWYIFGTSRKKNIKEVIEETERVLKQLRRDTPTEDEVQIAKNYLKTRLAISYQSPLNRAFYNAEQLIRGDMPKSYTQRIVEIEDVTGIDVTSFIDHYLSDGWTKLVIR